MDSQTQNFLTDLLLKFVSLETLMYYYNRFHADYENIRTKIDKSIHDLGAIWWETTEPNHYSNYLSESGWYYDRVAKLLTDTNDLGIVATAINKRIPWLSAEIYYGTVKLADCSEWISAVRYRGVDLTTDVILQVWASENTHKINKNDLAAYRFEVIDENGTELKIGLGKVVTSQ